MFSLALETATRESKRAVTFRGGERQRRNRAGRQLSGGISGGGAFSDRELASDGATSHGYMRAAARKRPQPRKLEREYAVRIGSTSLSYVGHFWETD